jgi:hypothetical protein
MKSSPRTQNPAAAILGSIFAAVALATAASAAPVINAALDIASPVQLSGSDAASAHFADTLLPSLGADIFGKNTAQMAEKLGASPLDPANLTLATASTVRIYFVGENAGNVNMLGYSTADEAKMIFPIAQSTMSWGGTDRPGWAPIQPGDFVDLGVFSAGTKLDFFVIANGVHGGTDVLSSATSTNADGLVHAAALSIPGSPYLLFNLEDIVGESVYGFNDLIFVAQIIPLKGLAAPEPSLAIGGVIAAVSLLGIRRRQR